MKKIVVLGGGISGYGSAILAKKKGFDVFLSDKGRIADRYKAKLDQWQVPYEEGHHSEERILAADEVVKSPGIPDKAPLIVKLREAGIPVISEMEFAGRYLGKARTICVTGSNGKTTTTSLIYKILRDAGYNVALGGNIGESFAYSVATGDYDWYVLELSSFQLDGMFRFRAHIGVLTNITPDHLDRYDYCFQNYVDAKMRITQNQNSRDFFIYSGDDEVIWQQLPKYDLRMKQLPFAAKNAVASGAGDAFLLDGKFTATVGRESVEIDTAKMRIPGLHNAYNAMAAALAALAAGVSPTRIRSSIYDFAPVEHRLAPAGEIGRRDRALKELYLDKASGLLTTEQFREMSGDYAREKAAMSERLARLEETMARQAQPEPAGRALEDFVDREAMPAQLLAAFVERIEVGTRDGGGRQAVRIAWKI